MSTEKLSKEVQTKALSQIAVIRRFYFSMVRWILLKPLVKLSYIVNGKVMGEIKWYQRRFTTPVRFKLLNNICYKLTKYVMFR